MKKENIEDDNREEIGKGHYFEDDLNRPEKDTFEKGKKKKCKCIHCKVDENCPDKPKL